MSNQPTIEIRELSIDDLAEIFHLGESLFTSSEVPNLYRTWDEYEVVGHFLDEPEHCLVAENEKEEIIGFALGSIVIKPRSAWKYGYISWLGIHPDYRRSGLATKLFNYFKMMMVEEGVRILMVDTESDNDSAVRFFRKMGFDKSEPHVYLTLNLSQTNKKRKTNRSKSNREDD